MRWYRLLVAAALAAALVMTAVLAAAGGAPAAQTRRAVAIQQAIAGVREHASLTHAGIADSFNVRDVVLDRSGASHVRLDRTYRGLRVRGGDLVAHIGASGALRGVSQTLRAKLALRIAPRLARAAAVRVALRRFVGRAVGANTELIVDAVGRPTLAYEVVVRGFRGQSPVELHVIVNARTGAVRSAWDAIEHATGTGNGFFDGVVTLQTTPISGGYRLTDPTRGNQYTCDMRNKQNRFCANMDDADNVWGDGTLSNRQSVAVDAQYGTAETWDYYLNVHGRSGIANDGNGSYNRVHYGRKYNNAFWSDSCFCMTYGDGDGVTYNPFDSLDVAGHEMSHGVTSRTANLTYSGESGGLNEGNSDIFGTMVEFYAGNANDTPDYKIGEKLYRSNPGESRALRYMWQPSLDGRSADCWYSGVGSLDVHYSSGVANHFYYLLAEGSAATPASPTCDGSTVNGIGRSAAERIWYRALTVYMTSSTNYQGARAACLSAAADLYGVGSQEHAAVAAAWTAVSVV